jgi:peptide chain release factor subunit 1
MISKSDLERVLQRGESERPVLSLFLDMSVDNTNKRHHQVFLNQKRTQFAELAGADASLDASDLDQTLDQVEGWLQDGFEEENRGVVIYAEVGGDYFETLQFPVPIQNRMVVSDRPVVGPLAQVIESYHHHGVVLLDREHARILSIYLGTLLDEFVIRTEPVDTPHDVQAGGYSQSRFQRRKREETKHFFREFAKELDEFHRRHSPDDLVILGTDENVARFREHLSESLLEKLVYTGPMAVDEPATEILARLEPHLQAERDREAQEVVLQVRERVANDYLATAGVQGTLTALQEGKVDTLVLSRDHQRDGSRCGQCGFVFARDLSTCPYCGSNTLAAIDAVEEMVRMAEGQGVNIEFVEPGTVDDLRGVGALLRF